MLPTSTLIIPPFLIAALAGWLNSNGWPKWTNAIISFIVIVFVAWIWSLFSGKLVSDFWANFIIVAGVCAAFVAGPLAPLQQWFTQRTASPLKFVVALFWSPQIATTQPVTQRRSSRYQSDSQFRWSPPSYPDLDDDEDDDDEEQHTAIIPVISASSESATPEDLPPVA